LANLNREDKDLKLTKDNISQNETTSTSSKDDINYVSSNEDKNMPIETKNSKDFQLNSNRDQCENNNKNIPFHTIFLPKSKSRFSFISNNEENDSEKIDIPGFINDLIFKKTSRLLLTKYIKSMEDILYTDKTLQNEFNKQNDWAQFIIQNKTYIENLQTNNKKIDSHNPESELEFIEDFDYINNLVLNKFKIYK
jgi:hypothetical protein